MEETARTRAYTRKDRFLAPNDNFIAKKRLERLVDEIRGNTKAGAEKSPTDRTVGEVGSLLGYLEALRLARTAAPADAVSAIVDWEGANVFRTGDKAAHDFFTRRVE